MEAIINADAKNCKKIGIGTKGYERRAGARIEERERTQARGEAALGNNTKSSATFRRVLDPNSFEIQEFTLDEVRREYVQKKDVSLVRDERFEMQTASAKILETDETPRKSAWRVVTCLKKRIAPEVAVLYAREHKKAHFGNLAVCGSVWTCPVCSAKISERRKEEIVTATDLHTSAGGGLYLITLTWSHKRHDDLKKMVVASREALKKLRVHRRYVEFLASVGYVGMIRAFEVTHGDANGWHPHFHELFFTSEKLTREQLRQWQQMLFERWRQECISAGLGEPNRKAGVSIQEGLSAAEYISKFGHDQKWGVASELTRSQAKKGKKSKTPWDLLRFYSDGEKSYGHLFKEYAHAFFGARQVFWSKGFKAKFQIDEMTDEEIALQEETRAVVVAKITKEAWKRVLRQVTESRSMILRLIEDGGGQEGVDTFIEGLPIL